MGLKLHVLWIRAFCDIYCPSFLLLGEGRQGGKDREGEGREGRRSEKSGK